MSEIKDTKKSSVKNKKGTTEIVASKDFGLDLGKMNIQLVGENGLTDMIPSRIEVGVDGTFGNTFNINEVKCVISVDSPFSTNQNKNEEHSIFLGHYLLSKHCDNGDVVDVGIGLPLDIYKNMEERLAYAENFRRSGKPVIVDGKTFTINTVLVCPEGISATTQHKLRRNTLVIDIGGRNINLAVVDIYGRPIIASIDTLDEGMHSAIDNIRKELRSNNIVNIENNAILDIILNGGGTQKVREIMENYFRGYIKRIIKFINTGNMAKYFNRALNDILFVGGSSDYLNIFLTEIFEQENTSIEDKNDKYVVTVSEGGLWDNPNGYYDLLIKTKKMKKIG